MKNISFTSTVLSFFILLVIGAYFPYVHSMSNNPIVEELQSLYDEIKRTNQFEEKTDFPIGQSKAQECDKEIINDLELITRTRIEQQVTENPKLINAQHMDGSIPLITAVTLVPNMVQFLLKLDANPNATSILNSTALMHAAETTNPTIINLLLTKHADPKLRNKFNKCAADYIPVSSWLTAKFESKTNDKYQCLELLLAAMGPEAAAPYLTLHKMSALTVAK